MHNRFVHTTTNMTNPLNCFIIPARQELFSSIIILFMCGFGTKIIHVLLSTVLCLNACIRCVMFNLESMYLAPQTLAILCGGNIQSLFLLYF